MKNYVAVIPDKEYLYVIDYVDAALSKMHKEGVFEEGIAERDMMSLLARIRKELVEDSYDVKEARNVDSVVVRDVVEGLKSLRLMMQKLLIAKIHQDGSYNAYALTTIIEEIPNVINSIVGQTITIEGYMALKMEMKNAAKKLIKNAKPDDAIKAADLAEEIEYLNEHIKNLRKHKVKPNINDVVCPVVIRTFDDFKWFDEMAQECSYYLNSIIHCNEYWWGALSA